MSIRNLPRKTLCIALLLTLNLGSCTRKSPDSGAGEADKAGEKIPEVYVEHFQLKEVFTPVKLAGVVESSRSSHVYTPLAGVVMQQHVREGEKVKKGQLLLSLRPDSQGFDYQLHRLKAPVDGILVRWDKKDNERVQAHDSLGLIADLSKFETTVYASFDDLSSLRPGTKLSTTVGGRKAPKAVVRRVVPKADEKTLAWPVRLDFDCGPQGCQGLLLPGSLAEVVLKKNRRDAVLIPSKYLHKRGSQVVVVTEAGLGQWQTVKTGEVYGDETEILEGVTPDTRVVTLYSSRPSDGGQLKILDPASGSGAGDKQEKNADPLDGPSSAANKESPTHSEGEKSKI